MTPQFSQLQSLLGNNTFDPNATAATQVLRIRPVLKLGFQMQSIPSSTLQSTVQTRLVALPNLGPRAASVTALADENGQVTLSGLVQSEDDRRLVETLVRMEPGVRNVRNDLKVNEPVAP
ncbi:BON domain-containing protein [Planctomicrobium piriforme]|uniref:BON domain-containing protein n=1 Tax=Planctomicrobium piriforme TaxID=1576369 RepID=A0A1I3ICA8_9PLAN|nr:BON domain-containing protein [Planctomicrobium piriforme]SFI45581.1 BON domain-containing protein [Planctomicrobium piriforme]